MAEIWHKTCQKQSLFSFHVISGLYRDFPNFIFLPILTLQKVHRVIFSRSLRKSDLKTCIAALNHELFCLTFFTWWLEMILTSIMVTKHSKWYLQMSETLSMPIRWLCLSLTLQLCSPMSPSPKSRTFWLWPDLWRHSWPRGQYNCFPVTVFPGFSNAAWIFTIGPAVSEIRGGGLEIAPPLSGARYKNTPVGRGLTSRVQIAPVISGF